MRVWQVAGRVDELPEAGDWKEYRIYDQSFLIVRGKDGALRGFVNACRHRGNVLCRGGSGNSARFVCHHLWSYDLEGQLRGVSRPDLVGPIDKDDHGLLQVPVDTFAGFIFLNPDPDAEPLAEFLGHEVAELMEPYHLDQMVTVMNVREAVDCNWKVVVDAFQEGYPKVSIRSC
jgi:phenylpropionate dioxygenase-like ring-hydroxylating dioxygenase large terminal subunit